MPSFTGKMVELLEKNELKRVFVTQHVQNKLHFVTEHGRQGKGHAKHVVLALATPASEKTFVDCSRELDTAVAAALGEVDLELLWEFAREEDREYTAQRLAELLFGEVDDARIAGVLRALLADHCYFKRKVAEFSPRPAEQVESIRRSVELKAAKEARQARLETLFETLHSASEPIDVDDFDEEARAALDDVHAFLHQGRSSDATHVVGTLRGEHLAREAAVAVLRAAGRLPWDADPLLVLGGVEIEFPPSVVAHAESCSPIPASDASAASVGREDHTSLTTFSIDDPGTREVDDAITLEETAGGARVGIHIADVAGICAVDDPLDECAARRGLTVYLPTGRVTMLPERIGCELASLQHREVRAAVSLFVEIDPDGEIQSHRFARTLIRVDHRLDYDQVDRQLESVEPEPWSAAVASVDAFTRQCCQRRARRGALMLDRREMDLSVTNGEVDLVVRDTGSRSHVLVRELMILYNELGAQTAHAAGLEFVYRTQGAPAEPWPENVSRDPAAADRLFRGMKPSRSAAEPGLHASLGVEAYTQLTSPLRRYSDLVLQRQLVAHLGTDRAPYDRAALDRVFARMDELSRSRARLERESRRHWAIEYLVRHARHAEFDAIVVREDGDGYLTELVDTTVRGALIADDVQPGDRLAVKITEAKPRSGRLRFAKV